MAKVIGAKDWANTPLGPIASWPQSLRTTVSLVQASSSPISLAWGPGHTQIYNDGYWPICGAKHPTSMGQDFRECWASTFPVIGEAYATAWSGRSAYLEKMRMFLDRFGFLEETWFTFSFSPIVDESGRVGGLFHPVTELSGQMLSERRTRTVRDLAIRTAGARTAEEALQLAAGVFAEANLDLPFTVLYLVDETGTRARRIAQSGIRSEAAGPEIVDLGAASAPWSIAEALRSGEPLGLDDVTARLSGPAGPYPELPRHAFVLPIHQAGRGSPAAVVVAGRSSRLHMTSGYRMFVDLVASAIGTAIANARALEHEHRKADALAEIDRAKTVFFSNVSHEFRTPLTLILGPLEDELADRASLSAAGRERLETAHRNSLRLLKLVNTLLDFSRVEAGRMHATYEPVDLAVETVQLAGMFRSAIEKVGLSLTIDCPPLPAPVHVDREIWEKIVLNLISNALKHTLTGGITVELRAEREHVALRVIDTGIGIAEQQLPHVFERFHRVKGAWSRSHEGTGIGLALVRELAGLLGGDVQAASTPGVGTTFTVTVRTGSAHLRADQVRGASSPTATPTSPAFVEEASAWSRGAGGAPAVAPAGPGDGPRPVVVWADDNADMRDYVTRLLGDDFEVIGVADGVAALDAVRERVPDLVLSDVMMPRLDGFGLLAALRADPRTCTLPVILLSARAGAEGSSQGMDAGADDYLIKPFSARELVARVRTHVRLGQIRRAWASERESTNRELQRANDELEAFSYSISRDLRAPLRSIDGFAQILLEGEDDAALRADLLGSIHVSAQRMTAIVDDLLALSKVGRAELRKEPIDLTAIVHRIVADLRRRDPSRDLTISVAEDLVAVCDGRLMTIALENLLANAWKFTAKRPGAAIAVGRDGDGRFFVRDNGAGFDMAYGAHLFEPFRRLHSDAEFEGTGIGLAIVHRIVERHGGRVWARGAVDAGATIVFVIEPGA